MIADLFGADNDQVRWTYERYITARARDLVESHWREFALIADALLERETLTAEEISSLIYQARSDGLPALPSALREG
jgi:ATP-dependent Zn protease